MKTDKETLALEDLFDKVSEALDVVLAYEFNDEVDCWNWDGEQEVVTFEFFYHEPIEVNLRADSVWISLKDIINQIYSQYED